MENLFYRARQLRRPGPGHFQHFPTAPEQMRQAGLMEGASKTLVNDPSVPHQKPVKVSPQDTYRLLVSAARLNAIDRKVLTTEGPHPPQPSAHLPAGFVGRHAGGATNLLHQLLVGGFSFLRYPVQGLR